MESGASGLLAGINAAKTYNNQPLLKLPPYTMIGALAGYISDETVENFQPMGANIGILPPLAERIKDKRLKAQAHAERSLEYFSENYF